MFEDKLNISVQEKTKIFKFSNSQTNIQPQLQQRPFAFQAPASETVSDRQTFQETN